MSRSIFTSFPKELTDEEEMLLKKYTKLKKKKNAIAAARAQKQETKEVELTSTKRAIDADAADNTQLAKKLLQSGAIKLNIEKKEPVKFKGRPKDVEKPSAPVGFHPFPSVDQENDLLPPKPVHTSRDMKGLYKNFVKARDDRPSNRSGNTVHVSSRADVTEELLRKAFSNFGNIVHLSTDKRNTGFVTFEKTDAAERAISEINGSVVDGVQLSVSLSYRQPYTENNIEDSTESAIAWQNIASSQQTTGGNSQRDSRDLVAYDEDVDLNYD